MPLTLYTPFKPASAAPATIGQLSQIGLKTYTVANGVSSITISDTSFNLSAYKAIYVRFNNLTMANASNSSIYAAPLFNGSQPSGSYTTLLESVSSSTQTGWEAATQTTPSACRVTPLSLNFQNIIPQVDISLNSSGLSFNSNSSTGTSSRIFRAVVNFPTSPTTFTQNDYIGVIIGLSAGTFTGGTVSVFGVQ